MTQGWGIILYFLFLSLALGIAMILKLKVKLFQKHLMPTSMIAGFIGFFSLILAERAFGIINRLKLEEIQQNLGFIVYHIMAVGFISLALKDRNSKKNKDIVNTGIFIVNTYMMQALIGFIISLIFVYTIYPDLFTPFGLLLPLGFAQGPGNALSIGLQWESLTTASGENIGFVNGGNIGLSIATIGFLWALIGGVPFMNFLVKCKFKDNQKYNISEVSDVDMEKEIKHTINYPKSIYIDDLSIQLLMIGSVYLASFYLIKGMSFLLSLTGMFGETVAQMLWGFHFMIGTVIALGLRKVLDHLRTKNKLKVNYADNFLLNKISSAAFDYMIVAAISAISIYALKEYLVPVLVITTVGGLFTMVYTTKMCKWIYKEDVLEHILALYGMWTGTITTGIALLKEVDPYSKSDVPEHLVLGSGVAIFLGFPLMIILGIPVHGYRTGKPIFYLITIIVLILFAALMILLLYLNNRKNKNN